MRLFEYTTIVDTVSLHQRPSIDVAGPDEHPPSPPSTSPSPRPIYGRIWHIPFFFCCTFSSYGTIHLIYLFCIHGEPDSVTSILAPVGVSHVMAPPYEFRGNNNNPNRDGRRIRPHNNNRQDGPRHEFTFRFGRPTSERPLLTRRRETTPELLTGGKKDGDALPSLKFASLDNLTDTDEAEMDVSDSGEGEEDGLERPARKKRIVEEETKPDLSATPPAPKWSNPDPYTVLPPPDETTGKKTDVVKLIRKARLAAAASADQDDMVKTNEDFISFDMDDDEIPSESLRPPENAPTGPRSDRIAADPSMGGSRKRTHDDEIKGYSRKKGKSMFEADGAILDRWAPRPEANNTPWLSLMVPTLHVGSR